jgi:site-specific DNA-methyltransferase (adenine-specific)
MLSLTKHTSDFVKNEYKNMPNMRIITTPFNKEIVKNADRSTHFDMKSLFSMTDDKFTNTQSVDMFLHWYFGMTMSNKISCIERIKSCTRENRVQLWFLPEGEINNLSVALKKRIDAHPLGKHYNVVIQNGKQGEKGNYNEFIENELKNPRELIVLLGRQLSTAISIPKCDVVVLLNHISSNDLLKQMMFRCMTEDGREKKFGIVVDCDQQRVVRSLISLVKYNTGERDGDRIKRALQCCSVDDTCINPMDYTEVYNQLYTVWRNNPKYAIDEVVEALSKIQHRTITSEDYKYLDKSLSGISKTPKTKKTREEAEIIPDDEKLSEDGSIYSSVSSVSDETKQVIDYLKEIQSTIPSILALFTHNSDICDVKKILLSMKENKELEDLFVQQSKCMWGNGVPTDFYMKCVNFLDNYYDEHGCREINSGVERIKELMNSCITLEKRKELLQLLMDSLPPKKSEKKEFGEVFTPLPIVEQILDKLPAEVWTNSSLKWFDPCAGIGNFPVCVYYRLFDGLENEFPDEKERKEHIITNMLYMSELNTKNVFVLKLLFNTSNIYCGDTLKLNTVDEWGIEKFDIVVGNPPYNKELTRSGGSPFYNEFIERFIDECRWLIFIVPSRWFAGGKGLDKFRKMMLNRTDIVNMTHFDDAKKVFGNSVDIKGGVNFFLKDSKYSGLCEFNGSQLNLNEFDVLVDNKYRSIISKAVLHPSIITIYQPSSYFGVRTNDRRYCDDTSLLKCYVSKQKGFEKYIDSNFIKRDYKFWKVITARAAFKASSGFGNTFVGDENSVHTDSYISFKVNSKTEAESLLSYMKCKLPNFLLSLRKPSQDINENVCKWIPLPPLDRIWDNESINSFFKLTEDDIMVLNN